jgi:drug/metabolite transporter (DMT)-like permease
VRDEVNGASLVSIALFCVLMAAGQILFKLAAGRIPGDAALAGKVMAALASPSLWAATLLYGAATLAWVMILTRVPMSVAYPLTTLTVVIVPVAGWVVFDEPLTLRMLSGMVVICAGVWLIAGKTA